MHYLHTSSDFAHINERKELTHKYRRTIVNEQWLKHHLTTKGVHSVSDVFYAEIQKDGTLHVDR